MKVAIVGGEDVGIPWDDAAWQIWVVKPGSYQRVNIAFEAPLFYYLNGNQHRFPADEIKVDFGPFWFNSAVSWLMPFALLAGATRIALYGLQLSEAQSIAMFHWMWACEQLGVPIEVPQESPLLTIPA